MLVLILSSSFTAQYNKGLQSGFLCKKNLTEVLYSKFSSSAAVLNQTPCDELTFVTPPVHGKVHVQSAKRGKMTFSNANSVH